jgi:hypothetical protein
MTKMPMPLAPLREPKHTEISSPGRVLVNSSDGLNKPEIGAIDLPISRSERIAEQGGSWLEFGKLSF